MVRTFLALVLILSTPSHAANVAISALPSIAGASLATDDVFPVVDTDLTTTKKVSVAGLRTAFIVDSIADGVVDQAITGNAAFDALALKEPAITATTSADYYRGDKAFATLDKTAVGLGNVDNTSDATKDAATATLTNKTIVSPSITGTASIAAATFDHAIVVDGGQVYVGDRDSGAGLYNTYVGLEAGLSQGSGAATANTGIGYQANRAITTGTNNTAVGQMANLSTTFGVGNTAIGTNALRTNVSGQGNTAIGRDALRNTGSVNFNTALGHGALFTNTTGANNTAVGRYALFSNSTGSNNVSEGYESGYNALGSGNLFLGYQAGYSETGSDALYIHNSSTALPLVRGNMSTADPYVTINGRLTVTGASSLASATLSTPLPATSGGTAQNSYATGDILYASATNVLNKLAIGAGSTVLTVSGGKPVWAPAASGSATGATYALGYSEIVGSTAADGHIPADSTIPQINEGAQIFSLVVTPLNIGAYVHVNVSVKAMEETNVTGNVTVALFRNGSSNAVAADSFGQNEATTNLNESRLGMNYRELVSSLTPITYTVRVGASDAAADVVLNEAGSAGVDNTAGDTITSWIKATEEAF